MKYYNRDNYERNNYEGNFESYEVPENFSEGPRNVFVYGFIVGAVLGSAIGIVSLNKPKKREKPSDKAYNSNIIAQSEQDKLEADKQVDHIKSSVNGAQRKDNPELEAQKSAIQQESASSNLADNSPNPQHDENKQLNADESKSDSKDTEASHINSNSTPSTDEYNAQQQAIKEEVAEDDAKHSDSNASDSKHTGAKVAVATGGTVAAASVAKAASDKKDAMHSDDKVVEDTKKAQTTNEINSKNDKDVPNLVTEDDKKQNSKKSAAVATGAITASSLALAAKNKNNALSKDSQVAKKTENLLKPEAIKLGKKKDVPNLVTSSASTAGVSNDKVNNTPDKEQSAQPAPAERRVKQTHESATFNNGIITHNKAGASENNSTVNESNKEQNSAEAKNNEPVYKKNRPQSTKAEKAESKIEKRTFND